MPLSIYLSIEVSIFLWAFTLSIYCSITPVIDLSLCLLLYPFISILFYHSSYWSITFYIVLSIYFYIIISFQVLIYQCIYWSITLYIVLSISMDWSLYNYIDLQLYLCIDLPFYPSISLCIWSRLGVSLVRILEVAQTFTMRFSTLQKYSPSTDSVSFNYLLHFNRRSCCDCDFKRDIPTALTYGTHSSHLT